MTSPIRITNRHFFQANFFLLLKLLTSANLATVFLFTLQPNSVHFSQPGLVQDGPHLGGGDVGDGDQLLQHAPSHRDPPALTRSIPRARA